MASRFSEYAQRVRERFGDSLFLANDVGETLGLRGNDLSSVMYAWSRSSHVCKVVMTSKETRASFNWDFNVYTFDYSKTKDDVFPYVASRVGFEYVNPSIVPVVSSMCVWRLTKLRERFEDRCFTRVDVARVARLESDAAKKLFRVALAHKGVKKLATGQGMAGYFGDRRRSYASVYSFDKDKDFEDAVDYYDDVDSGVAPEDVSMEIQLTGDYYRRYLDVRNRRLSAFSLGAFY